MICIMKLQAKSHTFCGNSQLHFKIEEPRECVFQQALFLSKYQSELKSLK